MSRRSDLADELQRVRERTSAIVAPVPERVLAGQHHPLMGPMLWDLGHIAAFEHLWLVRVAAGDTQPQGETGLDPLYNPFRNPRAARGSLELPDLDATLLRMAQVRERALRVLANANFDDAAVTRGGFVWTMVAQHEAWHQETMLVAANLRQDLAYRPAFASPLPTAGPVNDTEMIDVPGGTYRIGTDEPGRSYDNERPCHAIELRAFAIDRYPVSNRRYLDFILEEGGRPPMGWSQRQGTWGQTRFGEWSPLDLREPVCHVSWDDAQSFAEWEGKRLPREAEWEVAARWDPASAACRTYPWGEEWRDGVCNVDHRGVGPSRLGSFHAGRSPLGMEHALGDVWEWVDDWLGPYPGFQAFPYDEFTTPFFGTNRVLRGGSWATGRSLIRASLRNWDLPDRRQIFAGFRCARDA